MYKHYFKLLISKSHLKASPISNMYYTTPICLKIKICIEVVSPGTNISI